MANVNYYRHSGIYFLSLLCLFLLYICHVMAVVLFAAAATVEDDGADGIGDAAAVG